MPKKNSDQYLSSIIIQSLALSVVLLEKFEIMQENNLFVLKAKQLLNRMVPILESYTTKIITAETPEEKDDILKGSVIIQELYARIETSLSGKNILDISSRKTILTEILDKTGRLTENQKIELFNNILDSEILTY